MSTSVNAETVEWSLFFTLLDIEHRRRTAMTFRFRFGSGPVQQSLGTKPAEGGAEYHDVPQPVITGSELTRSDARRLPCARAFLNRIVQNTAGEPPDTDPVEWENAGGRAF